MPGRPDFSQAGSEGSGQTMAVNERPELANLDASATDSVAAGNREVTEIYAPSGSLYKIVALDISVKPDADATTGDNRVMVRPMDQLAVLQGQESFDSRLRFARSHWEGASISAQPPSAAAQTQAVQSIKATENAPIVFWYDNNTDAAMENQRRYLLVVEEVSY